MTKKFIINDYAKLVLIEKGDILEDNSEWEDTTPGVALYNPNCIIVYDINTFIQSGKMLGFLEVFGIIISDNRWDDIREWARQFI